MRRSSFNRRRLLLVTTILAGSPLAISAHAADATWLGTTDGDLGRAANWSTGAVPYGFIGFFGTSPNTALTTTNVSTWAGMTFNVGAANYTWTNSNSASFTGSGFVFNGGSLSVSNSGSIFFFNNSDASMASLTNTGSGVIDFSQSTGTGGNNRVSAGAINGTGTIYLGGNRLSVGALNTDTIFSGVIADGGAGGGTGGSLVHDGFFSLELSGTNTYTGATTVNNGHLIVSGSIATSSGVTVENGAMFSGNGIAPTVTVNSGGIFAPGNTTPGTAMSINGNLNMAPGSTFLVSVNPTTSSLADVSGTAALGGATVEANFANGSYVAKRYTILNATNITGAFAPDADSTNLPTGFAATTSNTATNAYLDLTLAFAAPASGTNSNQTAVGNALVNYFNTNGGIGMVYSGLTSAGLAQASGETSTAAQQTTFNIMNGFMNTLFSGGVGTGGMTGSAVTGYADEDRGKLASSPMARVRDAYASVTGSIRRTASPFEQRWSVWAAGFGGSQSTDGNIVTGAATTHSNIYGSAVGADFRISRDTVAGFALAGGGTNFDVGSFGTGRSEFAQAGAFVKHNIGPAYINAALAYGWQHTTADRTVTVAGVDRLRAAFDTNSIAGRLEGGYRLLSPYAGGVGVTPYGAVQVTAMHLPSYTEQVLSGANTFALAYAGKDVTNTRTELGFRTDKSFAAKDGVMTLRGRAAWAHDFNSDRAASATFQALPGATFVVNGAQQATNAALVGASAEMSWMNGWSVAATLDGEFSNVTRSYTGKGAVRYTW